MATYDGSSDSTVLRIEAMRVSSGPAPLLSGFELELEAGELVGLTGPSGCGKSTLLRAIAGLDDADEGQVLFRGALPDDVGWPQYRRSVVLMAQQPVLLNRSVAENLARPFTYRSAAGPYPAERAETLLARVGIEPERLGQNARSLSVGQQQRVCLVRALLLAPCVVLLDEATSGLDEDAAAAVEALISESVEHDGLSGIAVSHDRTQVARWCHRHIDLATFMHRKEPP